MFQQLNMLLFYFKHCPMSTFRTVYKFIIPWESDNKTRKVVWVHRKAPFCMYMSFVLKYSFSTVTYLVCGCHVLFFFFQTSGRYMYPILLLTGYCGEHICMRIPRARFLHLWTHFLPGSVNIPSQSTVVSPILWPSRLLAYSPKRSLPYSVDNSRNVVLRNRLSSYSALFKPLQGNTPSETKWYRHPPGSVKKRFHCKERTFTVH